MWQLGDLNDGVVRLTEKNRTIFVYSMLFFSPNFYFNPDRYRRQNMRKSLVLLNLFALTLLFGCATGYQSTGFSGGYEETQLSENMYEVSFRGNGYTRKKKAADFALLRCAELTLQNGYTHFAIIDKNASNDASLHYNPGSMNVAPSYSIIKKPSSENTIVMLSDVAEDAIAYDAALISSQLKARYGLE